MPLKKSAVALCACAFLASEGSALAQTLTPLTTPPPVGVGLALLLTDGSVLMQAFNPTVWLRLTPDSTGSYVGGTWKRTAPIPSAWGYQPSAFASAVLADGRVVILGGEYNGGTFTLTNLGGVYDPVADAWTALAAPPGWDYIGDSPSVVLPGGEFLIGRKLDRQVAMLDPKTMAWTLMGTTGKNDFNAEEGWTLMPDGSVLTLDVKDAPFGERYLPTKQRWLGDLGTGVDLTSPPAVKRIQYGGGYYYPPGEVGPLVLRPDGTVFGTGGLTAAGVAHTAVYTPGPNLTTAGTWAAGPDFPNGDDAGDSSAVLLPSGNVLLAGTSGNLYEFDGTTLHVVPANLQGAFLMTLPSGEALVSDGKQVSVYRGAGQPQPGWAPTITSVPSRLTRGTTYTLTGTQLNGLSQAAAFGDELETSTNYPLIRITHLATGKVVFARTHDHSSMGVATGSLPVSTSFEIPAHAPRGPSELEVVANGIASAPVSITVR